MKKFVLGFFLMLLLGGCKQQLNKVIIDPDLNREILIGWVNREGIASKDFLEDEQLKYKAYQADPELITILKTTFESDESLNILVVFATWCGDSKYQVPDFFKIADLAQIKEVKYLAVDRKKNAEDIDMSKMDIQLVPTFIVYQGDIELGRIIESPSYTLENDLVSILKK
ncbi:MAG: thioredoxin family protein [Bacteroidales bacterium]|jgi:thiol-disulfide isomerase/thioredoxin|nr:thioredoxin family protein [Bacteroidales bacterium]